MILLAACTVTYGLVAVMTPITYRSIVTTEFQNRGMELVNELAVVTLEDSGDTLDQFVRDTGGSVMIVGENGEIVTTQSKLAINAVYEDDTTVVAMSPGGENTHISITQDPPLIQVIDQFGSMVGSMSNNGTWDISASPIEWYFSFAEDDAQYLLYLMPPMEKSNQTMEALSRVAPWLLGVMLVFSMLCALFYSRYLTRPIVRLSQVSQHMAELDFTWKCGETRRDEIGVLGRNLNDMSQRLSTALTDLKDANAALQRDIDRERELERQRLAFFSAASHELKTPVTILKGQLTGMLEGIDVYRDRDKYLAKSLQVTGRMESLVQEILTVSRMESNGFTPVMQTVDLADMVRAQLLMDEDLILQKKLQIQTSLPHTAPIAGDFGLLQKVLDNVLSNGIFYSPEGATLTVEIHQNAGNTVLTVENSDSQIPKDALPHVFEPFYRADASRNRRTGGSGLGLYIVKMILDRHGAAYRIENTTDGVRFTICFV